MEDIDRELKLVQLQRERLALERELAIRKAGSGVKRIAGILSGGVAATSTAVGSTVKKIGRSIARFWKLILLFIVVSGCLAAIAAWVIVQDRELSEASYRRWDAGREKFIANQCFQSSICKLDVPGDYFLCGPGSSEGERCRRSASAEYQKQFPAPEYR